MTIVPLCCYISILDNLTNIVCYIAGDQCLPDISLIGLAAGWCFQVTASRCCSQSMSPQSSLSSGLQSVVSADIYSDTGLMQRIKNIKSRMSDCEIVSLK